VVASPRFPFTAASSSVAERTSADALARDVQRHPGQAAPKPSGDGNE
jgi:hypothetical protein